MSDKLVFLLIMDGWGVNSKTEGAPDAVGGLPIVPRSVAERGNAIRLANCKSISLLEKTYPHTELSASGFDVGLPRGLMGNSEVGHLNLGAGRIVWQEITRIDKAIEEGTFFTNPELVAAMNHAKKNNTNLHLMGLVSDGGVHSSDRHYFALLEMAKEMGLKSNQVFFHAAMDGRDTPPTSGVGYIEKIIAKMRELDIGRIATISGRYYLMDRDKRWERVQLAYDALTNGDGVVEDDPITAMKNAYARGENDEFIKPIVLKNTSRIRDNDSVIFFNFRADRAREITRTLTEPGFAPFDDSKLSGVPEPRPSGGSGIGFKRKVFPKVFYTTMTQYEEDFTLPTCPTASFRRVAFKPVRLKNILGELLVQNNLKQLRIAETEKYAHVTYFFNGGEETPFKGEDRMLVPSPKVATYDLQPEMSAPEVTRKVLEAISSRKYNAIVLNFANCDMVGHTGILEAAIKAAQTVDECVGKIVDAVKKVGGITLITADHGNAEEMIDIEHGGGAHTYHTTNPVPFTLVSDGHKGRRLRSGGKLCDVAPTILELLNIPKPKEMDGQSLLI
ncbi:MAG: 2,3-bisphosphoglycerate-independent phosphoglycerate mutase [Planctomycetes bacterium]|nr:2,3-bisphosphoglycerate-independent phosphoglycerate mutase [Planctomycetota bacterium]